MNINLLINSIKKKSCSGIYALSSDDPYLLTKNIKLLENLIKKEKSTTILKYTFPDMPLNKFFENIYLTIDMFSKKRAFFYNFPGKIKKEEVNLIKKSLENINPDNILFLIEDKIVDRITNSIFHFLNKKGSFIFIKSPAKRFEMISLIKSEALERNIKLSERMIDYFLDTYGNNPYRIIPELDKLSVYIGDEDIAADINTIKGMKVEYTDEDVFKFIDYIFSKNIKLILNELHSMFIKKNNLLGFLNLCLRNLYIIKYYKFLSDEHESNILNKIEDFYKKKYSKSLNYYQKKNLSFQTRLDINYLIKVEETLAKFEKIIKTNSKQILFPEIELLFMRLIKN